MATTKQEPSPVERLDQLVDRRQSLVKRRFEVEASLPKLHTKWTDAAATAEPSDDLPAQRDYEAAERELKNVDAAIIGLDERIRVTRQEIERAQRVARCAQARRAAEAMGAEAKAMEDHFAAFVDHAQRFTASHNQVRQLIGAGDQLVAFAYWVERQLIEVGGFPDLVQARKMSHLHGTGTTPTEAATAMIAMAETTR